MNFYATDYALFKIKKHKSKNNTPDSFLRVGVRGAGCDGLSYVFSFDTKIMDNDLVFVFNEEKIVIDHKSFKYLSGSTLDFSKNLLNYTYIVSNPNAKSSCSCGVSFSTK